MRGRRASTRMARDPRRRLEGLHRCGGLRVRTMYVLPAQHRKQYRAQRALGLNNNLRSLSGTTSTARSKHVAK